ncbi:spermine oxidase-like [Mya arenaria]|uniref:spermine oxidase-like n=1 Tax=Mya arenaria TaxID=6604 RepID=UPI0022E17403|nr:spermine oxidase-like [Mya arenaria]
MATDVHESINKTKVLIIGAGISGISAAEFMAKNGFTDFKILEASNRTGGRIWTYELDGKGINVEMGANWIHGIERNPIFQIADSNGLLQLRYKDKGLRHKNVFLTETGQEVNQKTVKDVDFSYGLLIQQCEEFYQMDLYAPYDSVGEYMHYEIEEKLENLSDDERKLREMIFDQHLKQETVVSGCNDLNDVSLGEFGCYEELPGVHYTIPPGFQSVLDILLNQVPENNILLEHSVKCIHWGNNENDGRVLVECENGKKFSAEHVIVTCSLGVLKASCDRMFEPPLPKEKKESIEKLGFGIVDRLNLYFDEPIVDADIFRVELLWDDHQYKDNVRNPTDLATSWFRKIYSFEAVHSNVISAWVCGKEALYMESLSEDQIASDIRDVLQKFLKKDIPAPSRVIRTRWGNSKNTRGSYCFIKVGASVSDVETLGQPLNNAQGQPVVQFAGEATHPSFYSTTHGALLTGHREAKRILDLYKVPYAKE